MEPITFGVVCGVVLLFLIIVGVPMAFAFALVGIGGIFVLMGRAEAMTFLYTLPYTWSTKYMLMALPLYVLMGEFAFHSGVTSDIFDVMNKWVGSLKGGLGMVVVISAGFFAMCSGSAMATAAAIGGVAMAEMKKYGYPPGFSAATVAAGGTVGVMIPPSMAFIVYALFSDESVGKLFMAGVLPGILQVVTYAGVIFVMTKINPRMLPGGASFTWKERLFSLRKIWSVAILAFVIMGGIYGGFFTATEAAAVGAFVAFLIGVFRRQLHWAELKKSLYNTVMITSLIFFLIIGVQIFTRLLALCGLTQWIAAAVGALPLSPFMILVFMTLTYIVLGTFLDGSGMHFLTYPIFIPILRAIGIDLIWFGVLAVRTTEIGTITPPTAVNVFMMHSIAPDVRIEDIFRGVIPFLIGDLLNCAILLAFPIISLWLPSLMS